MKTHLMPRNLLLALACALALAGTAQPTWRFHLAFEDGTGARDTLWLIYDTSVVQTQSHWPVDIGQYEQSRVNLDYSDGAFHVFTLNDLIDSTNSMAFSYTWFPIFETGENINAINWTPPMTIRWDTSLFHVPYLPYAQGSFGQALMDGDYFFFHSNGIGENGYNMLIDDSSYVDSDWESLFPFAIYFGPDDHVGIRENHEQGGSISFFPNPAGSSVHLQVDEPVLSIRILDMAGRVVITLPDHATEKWIDIAGLAPGAYMLLALSPQNHPYHGSFQKVD